jgi:cell division protein FtsB
MTGPRNRRTAGPPGARRATGRPLARAASRPLPAGDRAALARPAARPVGRSALRTASRAAAARRPLFTGRAVLLGGLVLLLALTLAGPVRGFLAGRAQIAQLAAEGQAQQQRIAQLREELRQQADPAYVARQARDRLTYVLPGDRLIVVVDGAASGTAPGAARSTTGRARVAPPWYDGLMQSVATADGDRKASP